MDLFSSYRHIDVAHIVRSNIRRDSVHEDLRKLIDGLNPLMLLTRNPMRPGAKLAWAIIDRIERLEGVVDILIKLGFEEERGRGFILQEPRYRYEEGDRREVEKEVSDFYQQLINFQRRNGNDLRAFLEPRRPATARSERRRDVEESNDRTLDAIQRLRLTLINQYNGSTLASGFVRRKIAQHLFRTLHSRHGPQDDDDVEYEIDQHVRNLKDNRKDRRASISDEVYIECLIRANFETQKALNILNYHRPVVTPPVKPAETTQIDLPPLNAPLIEALKQHATALNGVPGEALRHSRSSRREDKWESIKHIIDGIRALRRAYPNNDDDDICFSKMCRLLTSGISQTVTRIDSLKIETIARSLCDSSEDDIDAIDITTIRTQYESRIGGPVETGFQSFLIECPCCYEKFSRANMESMFLCQHMVCLECVQRYYRSIIPQLRDSRSLNLLTCPAETHSIPEDAEEKLNFFIMIGAKIRQWFEDDQALISLYDENIFFATRDRETKNCGNAQCREIFHVGTNNTIRMVRCPSCQFEQCQQCGRQWKDAHKNRTCDEYRIWLQTEDPDNADVQLQLVLDRDGITCPFPDCGRQFIFEAGGCEHYECPDCKRPFCANCSTPMERTPEDQQCSKPNCQLKKLHGHCPPNCFREVRDASITAFVNMLEEHGIDFTYQPANPALIPSGKCEMQGCERNANEESGNRLCEWCYKKFLWKFLWTREIEPWELFEDNNLTVYLRKASVEVPDDADRDALIQLAQEHLNANLGKPRQRTAIPIQPEIHLEDIVE